MNILCHTTLDANQFDCADSFEREIFDQTVQKGSREQWQKSGVWAVFKTFDHVDWFDGDTNDQISPKRSREQR